MPLDKCDPCCDPGVFARTRDSYNDASLRILCAILTAVGGSTTPTRYDWEVLCDPATGVPVFLRFEYNPDGTIVGSAAFNTDGTAYVGALAALVSCDSIPATGTEAAWASGTLAGVAILTGAHTTVVAAGAARKIVTVTNDSDRDIFIGIGSGVDDQFLKIGTSIVLDLAANNLNESGAITVRAIASDATAGTIYATVGT